MNVERLPEPDRAKRCRETAVIPPHVYACELTAGHEGGHGFIGPAGWVAWFKPGFGERLADLVKAHQDLLQR